MPSKELVPLLIKVISSWQVILATIIVILYFSLVFFVARTSRSRYASSISPQPKTKKKKAASKAAAAPQESVNDELGIEEQ